MAQKDIPPGLERYTEDHPDLEVLVSSVFLPMETPGVYVFPAGEIAHFLKSPFHETPFICSGTANQLRHSVLLGAQDFLRDPWDWQELHFRVDLNFQRKLKKSPDQSEIPGLSWTESKILAYLKGHKGRSVPRNELEDLMLTAGTGSRALDVHISSLRSKMKSHFQMGCYDPIKSVRGVGYTLDVSPFNFATGVG